MPFVTVDNVRMFYRMEGSDGRPVVVLSHSLGCDLGMWDALVADLVPHFRILRYDTRGHGASGVPAGEYSIERLARDVLGLADALGIEKFAFCGLSLGGMIGQWLAAHAGERLSHAILANTSPRTGPEGMEARRQAVLSGGMAAVAEIVMQRFFMPETLANNPRAATMRRALLGTDPAGYAGCCAAVRDMDQVDLLRKIHVPALVIVGSHDVSTPWQGHGEVLAREIHGAWVVHLPTAHLSNIERPRSFAAALLDFLLRHEIPDPLEAGCEVRRAALGDAYVDAAMARTTEFTREFQDLITRYAWGTIWTRPGFDLRTRRLLALATMAALGRWEEFRMHVRAGLARELEPCDVKEMLLQVAVYAGVPVANMGFQIAAEQLEKDAG